MTISENDSALKSDDFLTLRIQQRLKDLGYDIGRSGPRKDGVDGDLAELSQTAILAALETGKPAPSKPSSPVAPTPILDLDPAWLPSARMSRIIVHWTAGSHTASATDRAHYHLLIEGDGRLVRGVPAIDLNDAGGVRSGYAAHTLNCNTGSIGVSLCCMAGAIENPFETGKSPLTQVQWAMLPNVLAALCRRYSIPVTPKSVLSHAEVERTLGIKQRGKWDIARVAFDRTLVGATAVGDAFRARTAALLST